MVSLPDSVRLQIERLILDNVKDTSSVEELLNRIHTTSQKALQNISTPDYDLDKAIVSVLISSTTLPHAVHNTIAKANSIFAKELKMVGCSGNRAAENALAEVRRNAIMAKTQGESSPSQSGEFIKTPFKYVHWINKNPENATEWIENHLKANDRAKLRDLFQALYEINFFQEHWGLYQNLVKGSFTKDETTDILLEFVPCEKMHELSDIATFVNKLTTQELKYPGQILAALALEKSVDYERLLNQACKCDCAAAVAVIIGVASTGMQSKDHYVRADALKLFQALFEKKHGFDEAVKAATTGMQSKDYYVRGGALKLFKALFEKGHGFAEAAKAATNGMQSKDSSVRANALQLFKALVEKGQGFDEALSAAATGMQSETSYVQQGALQLFEALVEKGRGFDEAAKAATTGIQSKDYYVRADALKLFKALVEKDKGFDEAPKAATTGITSEDRFVRAGALQLFQALFEKEHGFAEAAKAATTGMQSKKYDVRGDALKLFKALVEKEHGFPEALVAAATGMQNKDSDVRESALQLFQALVEKGHGFAEAARCIILNGEYSKHLFLMLLESLPYLEVAFKIAESLEGGVKQAFFRKRAEAINKVRRPVFRYDLTQLCLQAVNKFGSFKSHKQLIVVEPLLRLLEPEDCSKFLGLASDRKIFNDNCKIETLLELLILLNTSKELTPDEKRLIISKLEDAKTSRDLHHNSRAAIGLIYMEAYESLTQGEDEYPKKLKRQAMKYFAISDVEGITEEQLSERLFSSRDPHALITYTSRIHSLSDPQANEALLKYITALIHGKEAFRAMRNDRTHNQHLEKIDVSILQQWQQGCESDVEGIQEPTKEIDKKEWLRTKLITDNHLTNLGNFPYIKDYIEGNDNAQKELNAKLSELKRESPPELVLQSKLMRLVSASQTELPRRIEEISKLLDKVAPASELKNDLKELLIEKSAKKRSGLRVLDSDDPYDLLLCGTEVLGSCLRVDGDADLNKGLLGHLLDGKIRLLCVKDDQGKIVARSLIRILLDDNGSPVIHQDRFYGDASYNDVLQEAAKKKASEMGLPLVTQSDFGKRFEGNLHSYKGPSPYEHVDPMGGVQRGYYSFSNVKIVE